MKFKDEIARKTLVYNGRDFKTYYGLSSDDVNFSEQTRNNGLPDDMLDQMNDSLDGFIVDSLPHVVKHTSCNDKHI